GLVVGARLPPPLVPGRAARGVFGLDFAPRLLDRGLPGRRLGLGIFLGRLPFGGFLRRGSHVSLSHLACRLGLGIFLGRLPFGGFLRRGSSVSLSHLACRLGLGLFLGRLPRFLMPALRSHGRKLLLGSFPLRFLGQSFFLGSFPRGCLSPGILRGG